LYPLNDYELKNNGSSLFYLLTNVASPGKKNKTCKLELLDFQFIIPVKVVMQWNT